MAAEFLSIRAINFVYSVYQSFNKSERERLEKMRVADLTPDKIKDRIDSVAVFNRNDIENSYKGVKVKWHVIFNGIVDKKMFGAKGTVMTQYSGALNHWVNVKLYFKDCPEIKIAQKGDRFWVTGIIKKVEYTSVYIEPIEIEKDNFFVF